MLVLSSQFIHTYQWIPFYMFMGNYLATFFLDVHFFNYTYQFLTLRNSKRILPFLIGGGKLGGILTSLSIYLYFSETITQFGIYLWIANGLLLLVPIVALSARKKIRYSKIKLKHKELIPDLSIIKRIFRKMKISYSSPIFLYSVLAIFSMAVLNQISEYYFAKAFNESFRTEAELASFLSIYTFIADCITLFIITAFTSKIIRSMGVQKSNAIYPFSFPLSMILFIAAPGILGGIVLRFYRKNLGPIIRTPIFNIIMAASPRDRMAEVKSFISAIISPLGMITGGFAIYLIYSKLGTWGGFIFTLAIGLIYIIFTFLQNRAYVSSIKTNLSVGYKNSNKKQFEARDLEPFLSEYTDITSSKELIEDIFNENPSFDALLILYRHFEELTALTKETILNFLSFTKFKHEKEILIKAIVDSSPLVRALAYSLLQKYTLNERKEILKNTYKEKRESEIVVTDYLLQNEKWEDHHEKLDKMIMEIKIKILQGTMNIIEFVILYKTLPHSFLLDHLIELSLKTKNPLLIKFLIPLCNKINKIDANTLLEAVIDLDSELLTGYITTFHSVSSTHIIFLLNNRLNISEMEMDRMFRYDNNDIVKKYIYTELFSKRSFYQKVNYLNYLTSINYSSQKDNNRFINSEIDEVKNINFLIGSLKQVTVAESPYLKVFISFIIIALEDAIDMHKFLILKVLSLCSGIHIDEVYETNLMLKDKDLDNYLLEYIEIGEKETRRAIEIFKKKETGGDSYIHLPDEKNIEAFFESMSMLFLFNPSLISDIKLTTILSSWNLQKDISSLYNIVITDYIKEHSTMFDLLEKIVFLKDNELFSNLHTRELLQIAKITNEHELNADKYLIREGEAGNELFIILEGNVEFSTEKGYITTQGPGSCIGELSVVDSEPRSGNIKTLTDCKILSIKRNDFLLTLKEHPNISINIMKIITKRLRDHLSFE